MESKNDGKADELYGMSSPKRRLLDAKEQAAYFEREVSTIMDHGCRPDLKHTLLSPSTEPHCRDTACNQICFGNVCEQGSAVCAQELAGRHCVATREVTTTAFARKARDRVVDFAYLYICHIFVHAIERTLHQLEV